MVDPSNVMDSPFGAALVSALLGLGLAALFRRACEGGECVVVAAPPPAQTADTVYRTGDRSCYRYVQRPCPASAASAAGGSS